MNIKQLEYFVCAAEQLNFTKAAGLCFISQTAMTQQIKSLEEAIGVNLFIRDKHHVELTNAGKVYLKEARVLIERSNEAIRLTRQASKGIEGTLNLGFIRGYGQSDMSDILRKFRNAYPGVRLNLYRDNRSGLFRAMTDGSCDAAFSVLPCTRELFDMSYQFVKSYPLMAVLWPGHHLAERESLSYIDLKGEDMIIMQPKGNARDEMDEITLIYDKAGYIPNVVCLEPDPETLLLMVSAGMGISVVPEYLVRIYQGSDEIRIVPLVKEDGSAETIDFEFAWPNGNTNPAVKRMAEMIKGY